MTQISPARGRADRNARSAAATRRIHPVSRASRSCADRLSAARGFTLLELLVVLAVILISTALIVPNLNTIDNSAFNAEVRKAASMLNYARRLAIVEGSPRIASFHALDPDSTDYTQRQQALAASKAVATWDSDDLALAFQYERNQPAESVDRVEVTFFPQGGSTGGLLRFTQEERSAMIRIDPITGRITTAYNGEDFDDAR